jgi:hypothetical protein
MQTTGHAIDIDRYAGIAGHRTANGVLAPGINDWCNLSSA